MSETCPSRSQPKNSTIYLISLDRSGRSEGNLIFSTNRGNGAKTKGTAFVVYDDIYEAKNAVDHLNGFNVGGKYLICLYYQQQKQANKVDNTKVKDGLTDLK